MGKLERIISYDLIGKKYPITQIEQNKINANPVVNKDDWYGSFCLQFKLNLKSYFTRRQKRRCGYCRKLINVDGSSNAIEHIVPRGKKPKWMFVQNNLLVSCGGCNSGKGSTNTLRLHEGNYGEYDHHCPSDSNEFKIFNPHFDKWSDHFEIQDEFFLVPKPNSKGPDTYSFCNMWSYRIVIDYRDQLNLDDKKSLRFVTKRIRKEKDQIRIDHLKKAKDYILDMIEDA